MKIADYGKAITSYIESPTTAQKLKSKKLAGLMEEYLGDQLDYQKAVDEGFQGTEEDYRRYKSTSEEDRTFLAEGSEDIVEPSKSMQVDTTTKGLDLFTIDNFKDKAEIYVGALYNGALPTADIKSALNKFTQKGIDDGTFSADDAIKIVQDLKFQFQDRAQKQRLRDVIIEGTGTVEREERAIGGGAFVGKDLGSREGFAGVIKPVSKLPEDQQKFINKWLDDHPGVKWEDLTNNERGMLKKGQDVRSGTGSKTKKGAENPQFQPLNEEGKKIAKKVYGTTEVSKSIRQRINKGEITMDTKPVKFKKGEDISLKMKRGSETVTGVNFPAKTIDADGNIETAKQMEKRFINFLKNRVQFSKKGLTGTGYANADIAAEFPISEKQGGRLARYYINKLGLKYKEGPRDPGKATVTEKATEKLKVTSGIKEERKLTQLKTKILKEKDLARKVDKAHRVSKSHMEKLGLQFDTDLVGMDSRIINQVIVKPSEIKLNNLYARQRKILDLLKENPDSLELKKQMTEVNKGVKQIVKDTSGRLIGVTIDLDTLEPNFEGIKKKNTFTKFLGDNYKIADLSKFSDSELSKAIAKAVDAEAKRGFVPNDFKNILTNKDSQKAILAFAKKRAPEAIKDLKFAFKNPTSKTSMQLLNVLFPSVVIPATAYFAGEDYSKGDPILDIASSAITGFKPTESIVRTLTPEEKGGYSELEKLARKKLNILKTVKPSDITTIASLAAQDPEYEGTPAKYLDFLKSQNLESIVKPAEKEFQEKVMIPFRETKKAQREPIISGLNELINQFSTNKYDPEEIL